MTLEDIRSKEQYEFPVERPVESKLCVREGADPNLFPPSKGSITFAPILSSRIIPYLDDKIELAASHYGADKIVGLLLGGEALLQLSWELAGAVEGKSFDIVKTYRDLPIVLSTSDQYGPVLSPDALIQMCDVQDRCNVVQDKERSKQASKVGGILAQVVKLGPDDPTPGCPCPNCEEKRVRAERAETKH